MTNETQDRLASLQDGIKGNEKLLRKASMKGALNTTALVGVLIASFGVVRGPTSELKEGVVLLFTVAASAYLGGIQRSLNQEEDRLENLVHQDEEALVLLSNLDRKEKAMTSPSDTEPS